MSHAWLNDLEDRIEAAIGRIRKLSAENEKLTATIAELEQRLEENPDPDQLAEWETERGQIRDRVAGLSKNLEKLLEDEDD